eukprot:8361201-Heterocapsa_arctica.AAC.1
MDKLWNKVLPDYKGKVGQAVVDLGITHRTHNRASINKGKRVADTSKVVKRAQALALAVRAKVNIIKTGGQSKSTYGAAVDPFTQVEIKSLRIKLLEALWPKQYMACRTTGLLLADQGELEPTLAITKKVLVNWLRHIEGGLPEDTFEMWEQYAVYTGNARGPINYFKREIKDLGWIDNSPTHITDHI